MRVHVFGRGVRVYACVHIRGACANEFACVRAHACAYV